MKLKPLLNDFLSLFFPRLCINCGKPLMDPEEFFCLHCLFNFPKTHYSSARDNVAFDRFRGKVPIEKAFSYLYYNKGGIGQKLIADIKYKGNIRLGKWIGIQLAKEIRSSGFFEDIDFLIPVPLHPKKKKKRGFNQSEIIAQGISSVTRIPIEMENLYRSKASATQTKKGVYERWMNTQTIFNMKNKKLFTGKQVLLIDDVLTTGSTLGACIECLIETPDIKISILTVATT